MRTLPLWLVGAVLAIIAPLALASTKVYFDGSWWNHHSNLEKIALVEGEVDGFRSACEKSAPWVAHGLTEESVLHLQSLPDEPRSRPHTAAKFKQQFFNTLSSWVGACLYSQKFGVYYDEITDFYLEHPNHQSVEVGAVMECLNDVERADNHIEKCLSTIK